MDRVTKGGEPAGKRIKVCYLATNATDWGGASRVLFTLLEYLDLQRYEPLVLFPADGTMLPTLRERGIAFRIWGPLHEPMGWLAYLNAVLKALVFLRRERVALLHINHSNYWRPAEVLAAKLLGIPIITHYHVAVMKPGPMVAYSNVIAVVSQYVAKVSEPKKIAKTVIYNSVSLARYDKAQDVRVELGLERDAIVISFVGQIREIKGVDLFIQMAHALQDPRLRFLIVGECRDATQYEGAYTEERLLREIGADARIRYTGYRADVENIYRSSDIIVMPSRWEEPFGLINIEAGASSRPIVATAVGGIPEVIRHEVNGMLVPAGDVQALVNAVATLVDDGREREAMGQRAREIVEAEFTDKPIRALERCYDELAKK